jgi:tetratricopeptide (TPR) repeat protein
MSLLLDALKRAEQEKLAKQGERAANDPPAPPPAGAAGTKREPANAALELQPLSGAAAPGAPGPAPRPGAAATAQAVFQAKAAGAPTGESRKAALLWIGGAAVLLVALGIAGYIWYSVSALQPKITTLRPRPAATPSPASGVPNTPRADTLVQGANAPLTLPGAGESRAATLPATTQPATTQPAAAPGPSTPAASTPATPPAGASAPSPRIEELPARGKAELAARLVRDAPSAPQLKLTPAEPPRVPVNVLAGYDALRVGDLPAARRSYAAALTVDATSVDAHLGLATVEARMGNVAAAASHYRRVLDLDPRNATALAGLASMADLSQPELIEQQLRADLARYPQSAALHFALGNLYASRSRWEEAQSSFFEALRLEPASADTLFNLAVAMDHMKQARLASEYYGRALEAAKMQTVQFDPARVARRIAELRP